MTFMIHVEIGLRCIWSEDNSVYVWERSSKARFPLGDFFRVKRLFPLSASLITSANAMPTKEKVASREKGHLVENGLKVCDWNEHEASRSPIKYLDHPRTILFRVHTKMKRGVPRHVGIRDYNERKLFRQRLQPIKCLGFPSRFIKK